MISNRKVGQTQVLYLKQFFDHYFEKKTMTETLSTLSNGLAVLLALISNFQSAKGIKSASISPVKLQTQGKNEIMNTIERKNRQINDTFQDIYQRLQNIFESWSGSEERQNSINSKEITETQHGDEQLYDMLNDYKKDNKKQKQLRKKAQNECSSLRKHLDKMDDDKSKIIQLNKENEIKIEKYQTQLRDKEKQFQELMQQLQLQENYRQQMQKKIVDLTQIIDNLSETKKINSRLIENLKESKEREARLQKKFESLNQIIQYKISQKQQYWHQMLQSKLNSQTIFQKGTCNSFRQFMNTVQELTSHQNLTKC